MTQRFCSQCGSPVPPGGRFCATCGAALPAATTPPPPPAAPPPPTAPPPSSGGSPLLWIGAIALAVLAVVAIGALVLGGGDDGGGDDDVVLPPATASTTTTTLAPEPDDGRWTVMVYLLGDTDLESFALDDLAEMAGVGSSELVDLYALVDRHPGYDPAPLGALGDFDSTKLVRIEPGGYTELADWGERNLGDPATLAEFVGTSLTRSPASNTALIIWDHGAGWPGIGPDDSHFDLLELGEIRQGVADGLAAAGVDRLDLLGFDACLMATAEVATALRPVAELLLASSELEPGHGWDYAALEVLSTPGLDAAALGTRIADDYVAHAESFGTEWDITLSLVDLDAFAELEAALEQVSAEAVAAMPSLAPALGAARPVALSYGRSPDPFLDTHLVDLGQVLDAIAAADPGGGEAARRARAALDAAVLANVTGPATVGSSGLSVYFPPYPEYFDSSYLRVDALPSWSRLIEAFYQAGDEIPEEAQARFVRSDPAAAPVADFFFDEDGLNLFAEFESAAQDNLAEAVIFYGIPQGDGSTIFYGEEPGAVLDDGSGLAGAIYDLTILQIDDGFDVVDAYIGLTWDDTESGAEVATFDIPMRYADPSGEEPVDVILRLVVGLDGTILSETYYTIDPSGSFGELAPDPRGLMFPVALRQLPDGSTEWIETTDVGLFAELANLQYEFVPIPSGTPLDARLIIRDFGGNIDSVSISTTVP